jgi:hypothetical protein
LRLDAGQRTVQVGIYSSQDYSISGTATNMGPVITQNGSFAGDASSFIPLQTVPDGAPINTTTTTVTTTVTTTTDGTPSAPSNWDG